MYTPTTQLFNIIPETYINAVAKKNRKRAKLKGNKYLA